MGDTRQTFLFEPVLSAGAESMARVAAAGSVYEWVAARLGQAMTHLPAVDPAGDGWRDRAVAAAELAELVRSVANAAAEHWSGSAAAASFQQAMQSLYLTAGQVSVSATAMAQFTQAVAGHTRLAAWRFATEALPARLSDTGNPVVLVGPLLGLGPTSADQKAWMVFDGLNRSWDAEAQAAPHTLDATYPLATDVVDRRTSLDAGQESLASGVAGTGTAGGVGTGWSAAAPTGHGGAGAGSAAGGSTAGYPPGGVAGVDPGSSLAGSGSGGLGGGLVGVPAGAGGWLGGGGSGSPGGDPARSGLFGTAGGRGAGPTGRAAGPGTGAPGSGSAARGGVVPAAAGYGEKQRGDRERRYFLTEDRETWSVPDPLPEVLLTGEYRRPVVTHDDDF
ncbi:MAG: hypothetical protein HYR62_06515 [Actinobacteria bacterium]|nr:hypothetical protein [Actinomycetota bacterium]